MFSRYRALGHQGLLSSGFRAIKFSDFSEGFGFRAFGSRGLSTLTLAGKA